jgi:hypothetical protein
MVGDNEYSIASDFTNAFFFNYKMTNVLIYCKRNHTRDIDYMNMRSSGIPRVRKREEF